MVGVGLGLWHILACIKKKATVLTPAGLKLARVSCCSTLEYWYLALYPRAKTFRKAYLDNHNEA